MKKSGNDYDGLFDGLNRGKDSFKMTITPEKAAKMLEWNNNNRPMYSATYINYARQMSDNKWRETGIPLIFDPRGLADGQHRLKAIVLSGKTYTFTINVTEDEDIHMYLDNGLRRSGIDSLRQALRNQSLKNRHLSVLKTMLAGRFCGTQNYRSSIELKELFEKYGTSVVLATELLGNKTDLTVLGCFARACLNLPESTILAFAEAWKKGENRPIAIFRNFMSQLTDRRIPTKREIYKRFYFTLRAFMDNSETVENPSYWNDSFVLL